MFLYKIVCCNSYQNLRSLCSWDFLSNSCPKKNAPSMFSSLILTVFSFLISSCISVSNFFKILNVLENTCVEIDSFFIQYSCYKFKRANEINNGKSLWPASHLAQRHCLGIAAQTLTLVPCIR